MNAEQRIRVLNLLKKNQGLLSKSDVLHDCGICSRDCKQEDLDFLSAEGVQFEKIKNMNYWRYSQ